MEILNERNEKWTPQVIEMLKDGWLAIGYTVMNQNSARKRIALASDAESQRALEEWVLERVEEGYLVAVRYYVAKSPCQMKDSEFVGRILLRHTACNHEVIVELIAEQMPDDAQDDLVEGLELKGAAEEFALATALSGSGSRIAYSNVLDINPETQGYLSGEIVRSTKVGRNKPCPCGSGKKYKKCCGSVMAHGMDYKDQQGGVKNFFPMFPDGEQNIIAQAMLECYKNARQKNKEAWAVIADCGDLQFFYPFDCDKHLPYDESRAGVLADAELAHARYGRPKPITIKVERITAEVARGLESAPATTRYPGGLCDFCSTPTKPSKVYDCEDFLKFDGETSIGGWAACNKCSSLIDTGDRSGLVKHQVATAIKQHGRNSFSAAGMRRMKELFERTNDDFRRHRKLVQT